jgi:hypothetical protein
MTAAATQIENPRIAAAPHQIGKRSEVGTRGMGRAREKAAA